MALKKEFNAIKKKEFPYCMEVTKYAAQQPFLNLKKALKAYFDSYKKSSTRKVGFPKFKKKSATSGSFYIGGYQVVIKENQTNCKSKDSNIKVSENKQYLKIPNFGWVKLTEKIRFKGHINSCVISQHGDRFYASFNLEISEDEYKRTHKGNEVNTEHTIVGYTREEIEKYFKEYIDIAIEKRHNCSISSLDCNTYQLYKSNLLDELALNYDNICYDEFGEQSVYSTWSVNNFFQDVANKSQVEFNDYWFANGGLPTILVNYLQKHLIDLSAFNKKKILVSKETFTNPTTLQSMDLNVLMAQTGYLSLVKGNNIRKKCELTIPNLELRKALSSLTLSNLYGSYFDEVSSDLEDYLITADPKQIFDKFNEILAKVPRANQAFNLDDEYIVKTIIQMFVLGADINCYREVYESKGRPDLVIELNNRIIVIEFKYVTNSKEVDDKLTEAVAQIKDRDYGQSFDCNKTRLKMAVVYDANEKKLVAFKEC